MDSELSHPGGGDPDLTWWAIYALFFPELKPLVPDHASGSEMRGVISPLSLHVIKRLRNGFCWVIN